MNLFREIWTAVKKVFNAGAVGIFWLLVLTLSALFLISLFTGNIGGTLSTAYFLLSINSWFHVHKEKGFYYYFLPHQILLFFFNNNFQKGLLFFGAVQFISYGLWLIKTEGRKNMQKYSKNKQ